MANILADASFTAFGCANADWVKGMKRFSDGTLYKHWCDRTPDAGGHIPVTGFILSPNEGHMSIPKGIRMYTANTCENCDPELYKLEGRVSPSSDWEEIASGEFPGVVEGLGRNPHEATMINSSYESGDPNLVYTEVKYHSHSKAYLEYKVTFFHTRKSSERDMQFAELEIPGLLIPHDPSVSPTVGPTVSPTMSPTTSPTVSFDSATYHNIISTTDLILCTTQVSPTKPPTVAPSVSPTLNPTTFLPDDGHKVASILHDTSYTSFGCNNTYWKNFDRFSDGTLYKHWCDQIPDAGGHIPVTGFILSPNNGHMSIPKGIRMYTANTCNNCDPKLYKLRVG